MWFCIFQICFMLLMLDWATFGTTIGAYGRNSLELWMQTTANIEGNATVCRYHYHYHYHHYYYHYHYYYYHYYYYHYYYYYCGCACLLGSGWLSGCWLHLSLADCASLWLAAPLSGWLRLSLAGCVAWCAMYALCLTQFLLSVVVWLS